MILGSHLRTESGPQAWVQEEQSDSFPGSQRFIGMRIRFVSEGIGNQCRQIGHVVNGDEFFHAEAD
jgi:hypothetical protein